MFLDVTTGRRWCTRCVRSVDSHVIGVEVDIPKNDIVSVSVTYQCDTHVPGHTWMVKIPMSKVSVSTKERMQLLRKNVAVVSTNVEVRSMLSSLVDEIEQLHHANAPEEVEGDPRYWKQRVDELNQDKVLLEQRYNELDERRGKEVKRLMGENGELRSKLDSIRVALSQ